MPEPRCLEDVTPQIRRDVWVKVRWKVVSPGPGRGTGEFHPATPHPLQFTVTLELDVPRLAICGCVWKTNFERTVVIQFSHVEEDTGS